MLVLQKQNIKGFSLLELLVVVVIVAIVSAVAYPNFSSWKTDRELRQGAEKITNLIAGINTQAQRGSYPYVQVHISPSGTAGGGSSSVTFTSKGMKQSTLSSKLNAGTSLTCPMTGAGTGDWDVDVAEYRLENLAVHFDSDGAVCFSKDGSLFGKEGQIKANLNVTIEKVNSDNYVIICTLKNAAKTGNECAINQAGGLEKPAYLVQWSRFGNVTKFKWSGSDWNRQ